MRAVPMHPVTAMVVIVILVGVFVTGSITSRTRTPVGTASIPAQPAFGADLDYSKTLQCVTPVNDSVSTDGDGLIHIAQPGNGALDVKTACGRHLMQNFKMAPLGELEALGLDHCNSCSGAADRFMWSYHMRKRTSADKK